MFAESIKGQYVAHVTTGSSVFVSVRLGLCKAYVVRYEAETGPVGWHQLGNEGCLENMYLSLDGNRVLAWYSRDRERLIRVVELDLETGAVATPVADS